MERNTKTLAKYLFTKGIDSSSKIQKILFFLRVEELKNKNTSNSFFKEKDNFEAWIYGPVNVESFFDMQRFFSRDEEKELFYLEENEVKEIDKQYGDWFEKYRYKSAITLINESHKNLSWINARGDLDPDVPSKTLLKEDDTFIQFID